MLVSFCPLLKQCSPSVIALWISFLNCKHSFLKQTFFEMQENKCLWDIIMYLKYWAITIYLCTLYIQLTLGAIYWTLSSQHKNLPIHSVKFSKVRLKYLMHLIWSFRPSRELDKCPDTKCCHYNNKALLSSLRDGGVTINSEFAKQLLSLHAPFSLKPLLIGGCNLTPGSPSFKLKKCVFPSIFHIFSFFPFLFDFIT